MAEKVLKVKTVSEVAEAISGLTDLSGSLKNVGTAAFEAAGKSKGEWKELEAEWQKANPTLKGVADSAFAVQSALNQMGRASTTSQLESGLVKSQVALNEFKAKIDEVRAAGGTIDEGMRSSLAVMESAVEAGKDKLVAMKDATQKAREELGLLGDEGKKFAKPIQDGATAAWEELSKLGDEGKKAAAALDRMEKAGDSPRELQRNAALAEIEINQLRASLDKAAASGKAFGPATAQALAQAEAKITSANTRAAQLRDTLGDMKTRGDMAAKGFEATAGAAGSFEGMLGRLKDTAGPAGQKMADLGFKAVAWTAAATAGYEAGQKINQFLEEHGNYLAKAIDAVVEFHGRTADMEELLSALPVRMNPVLKAHQAHAAAAQESAAAAVKLGVAFTTTGAETQAFNEKMKATNAAIVAARLAGTSWKDIINGSAPALRALALEAERLRIPIDQLPPAFVAAASALSAFRTAQDAAVVTQEAAIGAMKQLASEASTAFAAGQIEDWASKHAAAVVSVVKSTEEAGGAFANMTASMRAAYEVARTTLGEQKLAVSEYAKTAITSYAAIAEAQKKSVASARKDAVDAVANYNQQMQALNAMAVSEEAYSAKKKALYDEMIAKTSAAAQAEVDAVQASKNQQAALRESLSLTPEAFAAVGTAAKVYAEDVQKGATPTEAAKVALTSLAAALADTSEKAGAISFTAVSDKVAALGGVVGVAVTNVNNVSASISNIPGSVGPAIAALDTLRQKFDEVAAAAKRAGGAGGGGGGTGTGGSGTGTAS
jgi:hypothetical protein